MGCRRTALRQLRRAALAALPMLVSVEAGPVCCAERADDCAPSSDADRAAGEADLPATPCWGESAERERGARPSGRSQWVAEAADTSHDAAAAAEGDRAVAVGVAESLAAGMRVGEPAGRDRRQVVAH